MNNKSELSNADYLIINKEEEERKARMHCDTLPATLADVQFCRHPKAEANPCYLQEIKDEINLDIELGLPEQFRKNQEILLKKDIDVLTDTHEYFNVTPKILEKVFKLKTIKTLCFMNNIKEVILKTIWGLKIPIAMTGTFIGSVIAFITLVNATAPKAPLLVTGVWGLGILTAVTAVLSIVEFVASFQLRELNSHASETEKRIRNFWRVCFNYRFMKIQLITEGAQATLMSIPKKAKEKMKAAKDLGLFEGFAIAYPQFSINGIVTKPPISNFVEDPVIMGVAQDGRMFLVCWWNIKKNIDQVMTHLRMFNNYKVD